MNALQTAVQSRLQKRPPSAAQAAALAWVMARPEALGARLEVLRRRAAPQAALDIPPEDWNPADRAAANLAALQVLASGQVLGPQQRQALLRYSGWGGLSLERMEAQLAKLPPELRPDPVGLIHEYYTPSLVARAVAQAVAPLLPELMDDEGLVPALEPSCGIGRFIHAFQDHPELRWQAVEMSTPSARILAALRPDVEVHNLPFEEWVERHGAAHAGRLRLVVSNPPYGERGPTAVRDTHRQYREGPLGRQAYLYFVLRTMDLLPREGLGVFLVPYGLLSGRSEVYQKVRERLLLRHHLAAAYRLPSVVSERPLRGLFPGANLVTDLLFLRSRGGALRTLVADDQPILEGRYFELFPDHILGREVGEKDDEADQTRRPRRGYEVRGPFVGLPPLAERPMCQVCPVDLVPYAVRRSAPVREVGAEDLGAALGERVAAYLDLVGRGDAQSLERAKALQPELRQALLDFAAHQGNPLDNDLVRRRAVGDAKLTALLSAFSVQQGRAVLLPAIDMPPAYEPRYQGSVQDVAALARHAVQTARTITFDELVVWHGSHGGNKTAAQIEQELLGAGWCVEGAQRRLVPAEAYYTGSLWPKYDEAKSLGDAGDPVQATQAARLMERIAPVSFLDTGAEPRMGWIPLEVLSRWAQTFVEAPASVQVPLVRHEGLVQLTGQDYSFFSWRESSSSRSSRRRGQASGGEAFSGWERKLRTLLGYLNHDLALFKPDGVEPRWNEEADPPRDETAAEALDRTRREYGDRARQHFIEFLERDEALRRQLTEAYNRRFRGFVPPQHEQTPLPLARWDGACNLHGYQNAAVRRVVHNHGGLIAHGVGLGKTREGIAAVALARQKGRARRAVILVQNSKVLDWLAEFACGLPDYRIGVIGAAPKELVRGPRKGQTLWDTDTPEDRAQKWRRFQAGEFDAVLLTYSMLDRTTLRPEELRPLLRQSDSIRRQLALDARNLLVSLESSSRDRSLEPAEDDSEEQAERKRREREERQRLRRLIEGARGSERERVVAEQAQLRFIAEVTEPQQGVRPDPGIFWSDLGVDWLCIDEAQNFKNLFTAAQREGGQPQFLGAQSDSGRAWQLFFRSLDVQQRGGAVVLLSATPAKNSPLEIYSVYSYIDKNAFGRYGITDAEQFIDRYLHMEMRLVQGTDLDIHNRLVVSGFKRLDELREIIFRYGDFKSGTEVGLRLPQKRVHRVDVPMNAAQDAKYEALLFEYRQALRAMRQPGAAAAARFKILKTQVRMALVALHPELDTPPRPPDENGKRQGWQWEEWEQVRDVHTPKLDACAQRIMQRPGCGHIVFCDNVVVHRWLKQVLIEAGLPAGKIGILNARAAKTLDQRVALADKFNGTDEEPPTLDILICNQIANEGLNLQRRTCAIHHLDLPWEPATLEQRNGRGDRQGNQSADLEIIYYLTQRSMDMARYQLITGKRGWMVSLVASMDKETNNPGAQAQMTPEELLIYLSRDPEETRRLMEEQRQRRLEAARAQTAKESWRNLRALALRGLEARTEQDPVQREVLVRSLEAIASSLARVPQDVWPWGFLAEHVRRGRGFLFASGQPGCLFEEGTYVAVRPDGTVDPQQSFVLGRIGHDDGGTAIGLRRLGSPTWEPIRPAGISEVWEDTEPAGWQRPWPQEADRQALDHDLRRWLEDIALDGARKFREARMNLAPEAWRQWFWGQHGTALVRALSRDRHNPAVVVPVVVAGQLRLARGEVLVQQGTEVLPFTEAGYRRFVELAPTSGLEMGPARTALRWWWGAVAPQGLLAPAGPAPAGPAPTGPAPAGPAPAGITPAPAPMQTRDEQEALAEAEQALEEGIAAPPRAFAAPPPPAPTPAPVPVEIDLLTGERIRDLGRVGRLTIRYLGETTPGQPRWEVSGPQGAARLERRSTSYQVTGAGSSWLLAQVPGAAPLPSASPAHSETGRFDLLDLEEMAAPVAPPIEQTVRPLEVDDDHPPLFETGPEVGIRFQNLEPFDSAAPPFVPPPAASTPPAPPAPPPMPAPPAPAPPPPAPPPPLVSPTAPPAPPPPVRPPPEANEQPPPDPSDRLVSRLEEALRRMGL
jgi:hypothetical protein